MNTLTDVKMVEQASNKAPHSSFYTSGEVNQSCERSENLHCVQ